MNGWISREANAALEAITELAIELELRRTYGKPIESLLSGIECLQEKMNAARALLYPELEKMLEIGNQTSQREASQP